MYAIMYKTPSGQTELLSSRYKTMKDAFIQKMKFQQTFPLNTYSIKNMDMKKSEARSFAEALRNANISKTILTSSTLAVAKEYLDEVTPEEKAYTQNRAGIFFFGMDDDNKPVIITIREILTYLEQKHV